MFESLLNFLQLHNKKLFYRSTTWAAQVYDSWPCNMEIYLIYAHSNQSSNSWSFKKIRMFSTSSVRFNHTKTNKRAFNVIWTLIRFGTHHMDSVRPLSNPRDITYLVLEMWGIFIQDQRVALFSNKPKNGLIYNMFDPLNSTLYHEVSWGVSTNENLCWEFHVLFHWIPNIFICFG